MPMIALAAALMISGQATTPPPQRAGSNLTRDLNSAPPSATPPAASAVAPTQAQTQAPARATTQALPPIGQTPAASPRPAPATSSAPRTTQAQPPIGQSPSATTRPATATRPQTPAPTTTTPQATTPQPTTTAPAATAPAAAPAPAALNAAAIAALPFSIQLPAGLTITPARAGANANIYRVQRGDQTLLMIYAGPSSQFPIYDGETVRAGGRASVVVTEGSRRLAMEHLFQRATDPKEIHVWIASVEGADRDLAERIGQSIDVK
ncbi:hypothetical protein HNP47_001156 [Brevundimonas vesicularis]|uniref:Uncharacterized protein n=1 Tax=Brevundimonas vesicularis TaxID=41276 RepID=A0A7W9FTC5_BREVE|nr:hypothetical protein [Brevundimonas vesicularis]MBB5771187.1 hypothetical protein [Brevundimonas vesicularis]